jgi:hypothetical protein
MMEKIGRVASFVVIVCAVVSVAQAQGPTLYAVNGGPNRSSEPGAFLTMDQTTGATAVVGTPIAGVGLPGLAINSGGRAFAVTSTHLGNSRLIEIDISSGALLSDIADLTYLGSPVSVTDLSFQPGTGVLYGTAAGGNGLGQDDLVTINLTDGTVTLIGPTPDFCGYMTIAFSPGGTLYGIEAGCVDLHTIDPATGSLLTSTPTTLASTGALASAVDPVSGLLFISECCNTIANDIFTIDPLTGIATYLGPAGGTRAVHDLAFFEPLVAVQVPTLGHWGVILMAAALAGLAMWMLAHRRFV